MVHHSFCCGEHNFKTEVQNEKNILLAIFLLLIWSPAVQAQAPFYRGKDASPFSSQDRRPGDLFDLYVRTVGEFMVKHIPGNPDVIVQNMPGAGHIVAANYVYNIAKPDGLTLMGPSRRSTLIYSSDSPRSSMTGQSLLG